MTTNTSDNTNIGLGYSPDALAERKAELLNLLGRVAPELLSDNQLNLDKLKDLLAGDIADLQEHYELNWAGKAAARREIQKATSSTLLPDPNNPAQAQHMLIEGENLEVLRVLQKSYYGKVKMIYIDPPYNTGNDSFVYPDDYSETLDEYLKRTGEKNEDGYLNKQSLWKKNSKESGQYHSAWLSMMYPRLYLARNLLRDDGVVFIHIDENEYKNLEHLMCEIFGDENNLGTVIWDKRNPKGDSTKVAQQHEYLVVFSKSYSNFKETSTIHRVKENAEQMIAVVEKLISKYGKVCDEVRDEYKQWIKDNEDKLSGGEKAYSLIDDSGEIYRPVSMAWPNKKKAPDDYFIPLIHPFTGKACPVPDRGWRNPPTTMQTLLEDKRILFGIDESTQPTRKYLLKENLYENLPSLLYFGGSDDALHKQLGIDNYFENPKPIKVSEKLISSVCKDNDIILDFFAGSGTTAHAVMELNAEDGGSRQSISVQMPELLDEKSEAYKAGYRTIADITRARIEKVIAKLKAEKPEQTQDLACAHFKLAPSNFKVWRSDLADVDAVRSQLEMFQQAEKSVTPNVHKDDSNQQAMLTELLLKNGLGALGVHAISKPKLLANGMTIHRVLMNDDRLLWLCFDAYQQDFKAEVITANPAQVIMLNSCFNTVGEKADEYISNLQLELQHYGIGLLII
ncbi:TPA: site-specific DNA-methyltransferase [Proteus mirabilis]|nr:site-specific DNA-methyltransferase [Salmonella enterica subsp. enterica serovar Liverpool]